MIIFIWGQTKTPTLNFSAEERSLEGTSAVAKGPILSIVEEEILTGRPTVVPI